MILRGRDEDELTGAGAVVGAWRSTDVGAALTTGWAGLEEDDGVFDDELPGLTISVTDVHGISLSTCTVCILPVLMCLICTTTSDLKSAIWYSPNQSRVSFLFCCVKEVSASKAKLTDLSWKLVLWF